MGALRETASERVQGRGASSQNEFLPREQTVTVTDPPEQDPDARRADQTPFGPDQHESEQEANPHEPDPGRHEPDEPSLGPDPPSSPAESLLATGTTDDAPGVSASLRAMFWKLVILYKIAILGLTLGILLVVTDTYATMGARVLGGSILLLAYALYRTRRNKQRLAKGAFSGDEDETGDEIDTGSLGDDEADDSDTMHGPNA